MRHAHDVLDQPTRRRTRLIHDVTSPRNYDPIYWAMIDETIHAGEYRISEVQRAFPEVHRDQIIEDGLMRIRCIFALEHEILGHEAERRLATEHRRPNDEALEEAPEPGYTWPFI